MRLSPLLLTFLLALLGAACGGAPSILNGQLAVVAEQNDALALSDALEVLIAAGKDTKADRAFAYQEVRKREENTAAYAFARAAVTGRYVQNHGLAGVRHVSEVETWARRSREIDPGFRGGAATRMLGTLYVLVPATMLSHGDSEEGLSLLEGLVKLHPEVPENHLRLAEALVALGDPAPAAPHLCFCLGARASLRPDEQALLDRIVKDAEMPACPGGAPR